METIQDLNKKIWYRILKVLFGAIILYVLGSGIFGAYNEAIHHPYDESWTRISCARGDNQIDIKKSKYGIAEDQLTLTLEQKKKINQDVCGVDSNNLNWIESSEKKALLLSKNDFFTASQGVMFERLQWGLFLGYLLTLFIGVAIVSELFRRIFYYILLGSFKPKRF